MKLKTVSNKIFLKFIYFLFVSAAVSFQQISNDATVQTNTDGKRWPSFHSLFFLFFHQLYSSIDSKNQSTFHNYELETVSIINIFYRMWSIKARAYFSLLLAYILPYYDRYVAGSL